MTIAFGANEIEPTPTTVFFLESKCMLDLTKLELSELVVLIAATMVCAEDIKRFLVAASGDEPSCAKGRQQTSFVSCCRSEDELTRAFRDPPRQSNRDQRREDLDERHTPPAPIRVNRQRTQADPSSDSRTEIVKRVEERRQLCAMGRMSELSDQHRSSRVLEAETQTNDGASDSEHDQTVRESLQEHAEDDDHGADDDGVFPADLLDEPP